MKKATITTIEFGTARNGFYQVSFKASYTAASGRVISAIGWTVDAALKNLSKKTNLLHEARLVDGKRVEVKDAETYTEAMKVLHDIFLLNVQLLQLVRLK